MAEISPSIEISRNRLWLLFNELQVEKWFRQAEQTPNASKDQKMWNQD